MYNELRTFLLLSVIARLTFPLMSFSHSWSLQTWQEPHLKLFNIKWNLCCRSSIRSRSHHSVPVAEAGAVDVTVLCVVSLCSWRTVQTPQGLFPDAAQRWHLLWPVHRLSGRGREPANPGLLWHGHRRGWMDCKSPPNRQTVMISLQSLWEMLQWHVFHPYLSWIAITIRSEETLIQREQKWLIHRESVSFLFSGFPSTPEWQDRVLPQLEKLHRWIWGFEWWILAWYVQDKQDDYTRCSVRKSRAVTQLSFELTNFGT